jgi:GTPase SAR1 family protein
MEVALQNLTPQERDIVLSRLEETLKEQGMKPFVVSIMGQTGVGKSSLLNALFHTNLKTDPVRPCTKEIEPITIRDPGGRTLIFNDLPGIGESERADAAYLVIYRKCLLDSDVVLWAMYADNRSTTFDKHALEQLIGGLDPKEQSLLMSRITFVLTKADVLSPPPWTMGHMGRYTVIKPGKRTRDILGQKEAYFQETFIQPYGANIVSWTYNDSGFALQDPSFRYTKYGIYYQGLLTKERVAKLSQRYPKHKEAFERLYDNYRVISCSSLFRYNLDELLLAILNKLGQDAIERIKQFINIDNLGQIPLKDAQQLSNLVIIDGQNKRKLLDLSDGTFPRSNIF